MADFQAVGFQEYRQPLQMAAQSAGH